MNKYLQQYCSYRTNLAIFKALWGLNLIALKLLLLVVKLALLLG